MYIANKYIKKHYLTPVVSFEMMEEELNVLAGSPSTIKGGGTQDNQTGDGGDNNPEIIVGMPEPSKSSNFSDDFVFSIDMDY